MGPGATSYSQLQNFAKTYSLLLVLPAFLIVQTIYFSHLWIPHLWDHRAKATTVVEPIRLDASSGMHPMGLDILWPHLKRDGTHKNVGLLNLPETEVFRWSSALPNHDVMELSFHPIPSSLTWEDFNPRAHEVFGCPDVIHPVVWARDLQDIGAVIAHIPCPSGKDFRRLYLTLLAAASAATSQISSPRSSFIHSIAQVPVLIFSECRPIPNIFHCSDLKYSDGSTWLFVIHKESTMDRINFPLGSCGYAVEYGKEAKLKPRFQKSEKKEAYVSSLMHGEKYVCGAILLGYSIRATQSKRDLLLMVDDSISAEKREILQQVGWTLRNTTELKSKNGHSRDYYFTKLRAWELLEYDRALFIDSDVLVLRNMDFIFDLNEFSASGDWNYFFFNSGVFLYEPSRCMMELMVNSMDKVESFDGGDQGFLYEFFPWWHRLPESYNFMKVVGPADSSEVQYRSEMFSADPPLLYAIHYIGTKPWLCPTNLSTDCEADPNYHSDNAFKKWLKIANDLPEKFRCFCLQC